jgi:hypothetical protein
MTDNVLDSRPWALVECFGGAITTSLPRGFANVSEVRQVPDNQEVFVDAASGCSVIVELLERVAAADADAAAFHFAEIARANKAVESEVLDVAPPSAAAAPAGACAQLLLGRQRVAKFNEHGRENDVAVVVGLLRVPPPVATDVLVSVSYAYRVAAGSSDERAWEVRYSPADVRELGARALRNLVIRDMGLFVVD